jgi:hypothetical protein
MTWNVCYFIELERFLDYNYFYNVSCKCIFWVFWPVRKCLVSFFHSSKLLMSWFSSSQNKHQLVMRHCKLQLKFSESNALWMTFFHVLLTFWWKQRKLTPILWLSTARLYFWRVKLSLITKALCHKDIKWSETSVLDAVSGELYNPVTFLWEKQPPVPFIGVWD